MRPPTDATLLGNSKDLKQILTRTTLWDMCKAGSPCTSAFISSEGSDPTANPDLVGLFVYFEGELAGKLARWMDEQEITWPNPHIQKALAIIREHKE